jgi:peptidoglycan hydrolase-like protein with peptidoglycan-binding domain
MLDKGALIQRAINWQQAHPPVTGYTENAFRAVCGAILPLGANLMIQTGMQYTGKEETVDEVHWDTAEKRLPYSNTYRFSLDRSVDCSSFWYVLYQIFFGINVGTWTEAMYTILSPKKIAWTDRRPCDLVLYNFKADEGRKASHVAGVVGNGLILHTTSPTNPLRVESDSYAASSRVGVYRPLTDAQYQTLIVADAPANTKPTLSLGASGPEVKEAQLRLNAHLGPMLKGTGYFGDVTLASVRWFQTLKRVKVDGIIGAISTWPALLAEPVFPVLKQGMTDLYVGLMKHWLNRHGATLNEDNLNFGAATDAAVRAFQKAEGLEVDGICGKNTWAALMKV